MADGVGGALPGELWQRGAADHHSAAFPQPRDRRRVFCPGASPADEVAAPQGGVPPGEEDVLDAGRDAVGRAQRLTGPPPLLRGSRRGPGLLAVHGDERVDGVVLLVHRVQRLLACVQWGQLPRPVGVLQLGLGQPAKLAHDRPLDTRHVLMPSTSRCTSGSNTTPT